MDFFSESSQASGRNLPEERKNEMVLGFDNFNQPIVKKDLMASAQLIMNVLLLAPGTYPDTPGLGMDIQKYQFEFLSEENMRTIQGELESQLKTYLPTIPVLQIVVQAITNPANFLNTLGIGVALGGSSNQPTNLFLFFDKDSSGKVASRIKF